MNAEADFGLNRATQPDIAAHLKRCDADFVPPLGGRVEIGSYSQKIIDNAIRFEAWADGSLIGLVAAYCNDRERRCAYITSVSVVREWQGRGIASCLLNDCIEYVKLQGFEAIELEAGGDNADAISLYEKKGFTIKARDGRSATMRWSAKRP